jgi:hypothetical protein
MYNFNYDANGVKKPRYIEDINGDKKGEIIFEVSTGGSGGDESAFIYTVDTIATKIGDFGELDKELRGFGLEDIDGDGIYEVVFGDNHFNYWPYGNGAMASVILVWKWDGKIYRLANFKLHDVLIRRIFNDQLFTYFGGPNEPNMVGPGFDPANEMSYPNELMEAMLNLFYAGDSIQAERLFNTVWPDSIPRKQEFYDIFMRQMTSSPHWQELQKSNW